MKAVILLCVLLSNAALAQQHIAQFVVWKPNQGQEQLFETGYKQHLLWHKANNDTWGWYGWFIISGPRLGQFMDATFDHSWSDFDHPVKPAEDRADNNLHTVPFGAVQTVCKVSCLTSLSTANASSLQSKFLRLITLQVTDMNNGIKLMEQLKRTYSATLPLENMQVYKLVDGGPINQLILILGFSNFEAYGKSENLQEALFTTETALKVKTIEAITAETLVYRADMSLFPN
jgi:hypothetical protein